MSFILQEVFVHQDMEASLDPDGRKDQLLLTQVLGLETENIWAQTLLLLFLISFGRSR